MDRRSFCRAAAAAVLVSGGRAAAATDAAPIPAPEFTPRAETLARLARIGESVPAFVGGHHRHFLPHETVWAYEDGVVWAGALDLYRATADRAFLDLVLDDMRDKVGADGALLRFRSRPYSLDPINAGRILLPLFEATGDARFRKAMDVQFEPLRSFPRTRSGNYWHKQRYPWQVWLDGLYMAQPFQVHYARVTGDPALFDDTVRQIRFVAQTMRSAATGLYHHGWDESRQQRWAARKTGLSPHFWGRAMGWWVCALADVYEASDGFDAAGRTEIATVLRDTLNAAMAVRSPAGLWFQVLDQGERAGNYEEASASLMISYALLKAARLGVMGEPARAAGVQSLSACVDRFLSPAALSGICQVAGLGGDPYRDGSYAYYLSEKIVANDPKGVGALYMCLAEGVRAQPSAA